MKVVHAKVLFLAFVIVAGSTLGAKNETPVGIDRSLSLEAQHAAEKSFAWLASKQSKEGFWSQREYPALTALVLRGFLQAGKAGVAEHKYDSTIEKGFQYLVTCVQKDGGIYQQGMGNYNTAICLATFLSRNDKRFETIIRNAGSYLAGLQMDDGKPGVADSIFDGGIGYNKENHSDLSNSVIALESFYLLKKSGVKEPAKTAEKQPAAPESDTSLRKLNWAAAIQFVTRCQNLPGQNDQPWASGDSINRGGFVYYPGNSKAGEMKLANGKSALRSYGSMTYAGFMSYLFADIKKDDLRIVEAYNWLRRNYTLGENPGLGQDGLYYYYQVMAKALKIYGQNEIVLSNGTKISWRSDLVKKLLSLQSNDGSWVNNSGRWWENDPVLCTAYAVVAIEMCMP